ncbi:IPT/TIG domain-containing protein [Streptomyces sp. NPDC086787]|uniref:IPT/TIG domain-containing protein n=1 Tax=Streptomyces sp. NPDC086787 TaxID=3365759 RepID=UPI0037FC4754
MAPTITTINPTQSHNGVTMTITGTGLGTTVRVNFGGLSVSPASVTSVTVTCVIPQLCPGQSNVSVTNAAGQTSNSLPFFYIGPPQVTALSPAIGSAAAVPVSVYGNNLLTTTEVDFGDVGPATNLTVVSSSSLTVVAPAHPPFTPGVCTDTVDVIVTTAGGISGSPGPSSSQYTYYNAPTITALSPSSATPGSDVTVFGTCLMDIIAVTLTPVGGGQTYQSTFVSISPSQIDTVLPLTLPRGTYAIQITTPGGQSPITPAGQFTV